MRIEVDAKHMEEIRVFATGAGELPPKKEYGTDQQKIDDSGKPLYSGRALSVLRMHDGVPAGVDQSANVSLRTPARIEFGKIYRLTGKLTFVHYPANNFVNCSITADGIEPVEGSDTKLNLPKGD